MSWLPSASARRGNTRFAVLYIKEIHRLWGDGYRDGTMVHPMSSQHGVPSKNKFDIVIGRQLRRDFRAGEVCERWGSVTRHVVRATRNVDVKGQFAGIHVEPPKRVENLLPVRRVRALTCRMMFLLVIGVELGIFIRVS